MSRSVWLYEPTIQSVRCLLIEVGYVWDVNPILRLCEPLSCIFYCFCINELLCLVYSERVARRVMNSGVWPLSYVLNVYASVDLQGLIVRRLAWERSVFRGSSVRFVPEFK